MLIPLLYNIFVITNENFISKTQIKCFDFNETNIENLKTMEKGTNWPVVYILKSNKKVNKPFIYIGETSSAYTRMKQHISDSNKRKEFQQNYILFNDSFNKSAVLDIENFLIDHISADNLFEIYNRNKGQSKYHDYYQKQLYRNLLTDIWDKLKKENIVHNNLIDIENSDLFKFSPFKTLTDQQYNIQYELIKRISYSIEKEKQQFLLVKGGAGTGKSVLAISIIKYLSDILCNDYNPFTDEINDDEDNLRNDYVLNKVLIDNKNKINRIALVEPVPAFRDTIKSVFKKQKLLKNIKVINPSDIVKQEPFDIVIVDEAHRLKQKKKLVDNKSFNENCARLNMDPLTSTELDWIKAKTKYSCILFYDENQKVKISDIDSSKLKELEENNVKENIFVISNQLRLKAGSEYIELWKKIFNNEPLDNIEIQNANQYKFKIYDHCEDMVNQIISDDENFGLSRVVSGLTHKWKVKMRDNKKEKDRDFDFIIDGKVYKWNTDKRKQIQRDEIGCVYTCQGFDFNYAGVIIGKDVTYNKENKKIEFNVDNLQDTNSKQKDDIETTIQNIKNQYLVLLTRGISGTYLFIEDENLKEYLKDIFKNFSWL